MGVLTANQVNVLYYGFVEKHPKASGIANALSRIIFLGELSSEDRETIDKEVPEIVSTLYKNPAGRGRSIELLNSQVRRGITGQYLIRRRLLDAGRVETPLTPSAMTFVDMIFDELYLEVKHQSVRHNTVSFAHQQQLDTITMNQHRLDYLITFKYFDRHALKHVGWPTEHEFIKPWFIIDAKTFSVYLTESHFDNKTKFYKDEAARVRGDARLLTLGPSELDSTRFKTMPVHNEDDVI